MLALNLLLLLSALPQEPGFPQDERQPARPAAQAAAADAIIDLHRAEVWPQVGFAAYSHDFLGDPSPCAGLLVRAPLPFLAPREDELHEAIGLFTQLTWSTIDRDLTLTGSTDGNLYFLGVGIDFLLLRDTNAFVRGQLGLQYGALGDVPQLNSGFALLAGTTAGCQIVSGLWLTWDLEFAIGNSGDWVLFNQAGAVIRF